MPQIGKTPYSSPKNAGNIWRDMSIVGFFPAKIADILVPEEKAWRCSRPRDRGGRSCSRWAWPGRARTTPPALRAHPPPQTASPGYPGTRNPAHTKKQIQFKKLFYRFFFSSYIVVFPCSQLRKVPKDTRTFLIKKLLNFLLMYHRNLSMEQ